MSVTHLALCWKLTRKDGVVLGFTSHDQDIVREDGVYRAVPGFNPSAISTSAGLEKDNFEISGALTHASVSEADLWSGRYDGARLHVFMTDWQDVSVTHPLATVMLGDVETDGTVFRAETTGATALLDRVLLETVSPECRAQFGDKRCKVALRQYSVFSRVQSVSAETVTFTGLVPDADYYAYGHVLWLTGENAGVVSSILSSAGSAVTLREDTPFAVSAGAHALVRAGCDKRFATCVGKYGNKANFRGEPYVPGIDSLVRYPGL
jgi:uncharacterized phage protein (TIGR02218 family)